MKGRAFPQLIGLHGAIGAGKATIAAHLRTVHDFRSYSLSDPLRQALYAMDPLLSSQTSLRTLVDDVGWHKAMIDRIHGPEVNRLLATLRTDVAREVFGADVWLRRIEAVTSGETDLLGPASVVVTDITTTEEAQWVLTAGGVVWRVERPGYVPSVQVSDGLISSVITNDATVRALTRRVDRAVANLITLTDHNADAA
jgi:hypothetical protein